MREAVMSVLNSNHFSLWSDTSDDSPFVHQAMSTLGFLCDFSQLNREQQQLALALAEHLKRCQRTADAYES
jgi:hypothetical protein